MSSGLRQRRENKYTEIKGADIVCTFPKNMLLEVTNCCNDSCLFCAHSKCTKKRGFIKPEIAKKILREAYEEGAREVGFYGTGEPLLNKNLEEYILYAKQLGYTYTYITTNGALLTPKRANTLVSAGIDSIKFSINASNKQDYILIHGVDEFETVINNLKYLNELRKKNKMLFALYISYVATRYTNKGIEEFKQAYGKYVDDILYMNCGNIAGCMAEELKVLSVTEQISGFSKKNEICPMIFNTIHVNYEGYLTMCCADFQNYLVVADLNKESIAVAWNNSYAQKLRMCHLEHQIQGTLCYNCIYNSTERVEPLREEYAISVDFKTWSKSKDIKKRILSSNIVDI